MTNIVKEWLSSNNYPEYYCNMLTKRVISQLMALGMICLSGKVKEPTQKGIRSGIGIEGRVRNNGELYKVLVYDEGMQKMIYKMLPTLKEGLDNESGGEYLPKHIRSKLKDSDYASGIFYGFKIHFRRNYGPNYFSEDEIKKLLNGEVIVFNAGYI